MATDLESILTDSLRTRAEAGEAIAAAALVRRAAERGGRLRRRQRVLSAAAAVAVCAGVSVTAAVVAHAPSSGVTAADVRPSASSAHAVDLALLPTAQGHPGAITGPEVIGTDVNVLHFSVDELASAARRVSWSSEIGVETADVQRTDFQVHVALARARGALPTSKAFSGGLGAAMSEPVETSIDGRPATLRTSAPWDVDGRRGQVYLFVWQPADGFWAQADVQTTGRQQADLILSKIRFDQARQCVVPFRLRQLPPGATVQECSVALAEDATLPPQAAGLFSGGALTVSDGRRRLQIEVSDIGNSDEYNRDAASPGSGMRQLSAGPYQVFADPNGRDWTMHIRGLFFTITTPRGKGAYTQDEVLEILAGVELADHLHDPATWPTDS